MSDFKFEASNIPSNFSFSKIKISYDEEKNRIHATIPVLLTWTGLNDPEIIERDDGSTEKKWTISGAIPKGKEGDAAVAAIKEACDTMMKADGQKKAIYPHFIKDGAAKDGSGMWLKSGGALEDFHYFSAKTKRAPRLLEMGDSGMSETDGEAVYSGGYAYIACDIFPVSYGAQGGNKRGSTCWFSKILFAGGGQAIGTGAGSSDSDDFGDFVSGTEDSVDELI